jgi:prohibitin 1
MRNFPNMPPMSTKVYVYVIGAVVLFVSALTFRPFAIVNAGERGVVMKFGKVQDRILDEGIHPILPIVTSVRTLSVRVAKNDIKAEASSKDLQNLTMNIAVNWHLDPARVNQVYQRLGDEEQILIRVIEPAISEVVKAATAKKTAEEVITKRTELKGEIDQEIQQRLEGYGVLVDDVSLVDVSFSDEFVKAIESKQIAEQEAKQAEFDALKAEKQAQADVNRAKGRAEAQRLLRQNLSAEILQQQAIEKWDGKFPAVMGGEGSLPLININPDAIQPQQEK